jgi:1-acyl-sn-glycerol-3-phosphate acyltransferase
MTDLWLPRSTCGEHCLPLAARRNLATAALAAWRVFATIMVILAAAVTLPFVANHHLARRLARAVLKAAGVRHRSTGRLPERHALIVANHVSWLDIVVILAHTPARLLAKHEVRGWPVIGRMARRLGTVFVDRTRPKTLRDTVADVAAALREGAVVAVFPEGTTWCGRSGGRFRPAMFQAAIDAGAPVVPVRLAFSIDGAPTTVAAFLGEDTLLASVRRVVAARGLTVELRAHPALHPGKGAARRTLARAAGASVGTQWTLEPTVGRIPASAPEPGLVLRPA